MDIAYAIGGFVVGWAVLCAVGGFIWSATMRNCRQGEYPCPPHVWEPDGSGAVWCAKCGGSPLD